MKYSRIYLLLFVLYTSCDNIKKGPENLTEDDFRTITINNNYSLDLPNYLSKGELNPDASLQYMHMFKETYVVVIDENLEDAKSSLRYLEGYDAENTILDNYIEFQKESFRNDSQIISMDKPKLITINGLKAKQFNMVLNFPDLDENISYLVTFFQSQERVYMLLSWTLESRTQRYMNTFKTIANSFQVKERRSKTKRN